MLTRGGILLFFTIFLFFPYGLLLFKFDITQSLDRHELIWALQNSFLQASLSALGSVFIGFWLYFGFLRWKRHLKDSAVKFLEVLLILPSLLPPLFVLLIALNFVEPFPTGVIGVVLVHVLMNAGLVSLMAKSLVESKLVPLIELASVEGAGRWSLLWVLAGAVKRDLFGIFLFVFILCFTSFSIPLIAGGGRATTLEILIYEKIRISGQWGEALGLSFIQLFLILILSLLPFRPTRKLFGRSHHVPGLESFWGAGLVALYTIVPLIYFFVQSALGWSQVLKIPGLWEQALSLVPDSLFFGLSVGVLVLMLLMLSAWGSPFSGLQKLISGIVSPSTALLGFSFLFFLSNEGFWSWGKWILGFSYLIFSTLYRWGWDRELNGLQEQIQVAETLGASRSRIFWSILVPQLLPTAGQAAGIASLWALGDFALGKILIGRDVTLSLLIETLMSSYRLQAAMALMGLLLLMGAFCFFLFWGFANVSRRALEQKI